MKNCYECDYYSANLHSEKGGGMVRNEFCIQLNVCGIDTRTYTSPPSVVDSRKEGGKCGPDATYFKPRRLPVAQGSR